VFVFDQAMQKNPALGGFPPVVQGAVAWSGTGVTASKFSYAWSADGKTLTCDYSGDLPGNTAITWQLNPPGAAIKLQNEDGEELASNTYLGEFTTGQGSGGGGDCDPSGVPTTWGSYTISKYGHYNQSSAADPVPDAEEPFMFYSGVVAPDAGPAVTAGSVTLPNNTNKPLQPLGLFLYYTESFATEAALETAYPAGSYVLRFTQTGLAERVIPMTITAGTLPVPKIANFAEAQAVNAGQDFTLRWNAFTGAGAQDSLSVFISDGMGNVVFQAPDRCVPRELPVTATSIVIPAGTFQSNRTYSASLNFSKVFYASTNTVPEMGGYGTDGKMTDFTIKTGTGGGGTADPARFTGYRLLPNGDPEMDLTGTALKSYTIERTASLLNPVWQNVGTVTMDATGKGTFEDTQSGKTLPLFYRAVAN